MFAYLYYFILATALLATSNAQDLINDVNDDRRGLLLVDNQQTTCQVVILDESNGVVAASCLVLNGNNLDSTVDHRVGVRNQDGSFNGLYKISSAKAHEKYDPNTFANNLATVKFQMTNGLNCGQMDFDSSKWQGMYKLYEGFSPMPPHKWNGAQASQLVVDANMVANCKDYSGLYVQNDQNIICTNEAVHWSMESRGCYIPYNSIYGGIAGKAKVGALYSYSMVPDNPTDYCQGEKNTKAYHFYTKLDKYYPWIAQNTGVSSEDVAKLQGNPGFAYSYNPSIRGRFESKPVSLAVTYKIPNRAGTPGNNQNPSPVPSGKCFIQPVEKDLGSSSVGSSSSTNVGPLLKTTIPFDEPNELATETTTSTSIKDIPKEDVPPTTITTTSTATQSTTTTTTVTSSGTVTSTVTSTVTINNGGNQNGGGGGNDSNNINVNVQNGQQQNQQAPPAVPSTTTVTTTSISMSVSVITVPGPALPAPTLFNTGLRNVVSTTTSTETDTITDVRYSYITIYGVATTPTSSSSSTEILVTSDVEPSSSDNSEPPLDEVEHKESSGLSNGVIAGIILGILALLLLLFYLYRRYNKRKNADWGVTRVRRWFFGDRIAKEYPYPESYGSSRNSHISDRSTPPRY